MKKFVLTVFIAATLFLSLFTGSCEAQPRNDYEITFTPVPGATSYDVFLEEKTTNTGFTLLDDMDYLSPNVTTLRVGTITTTSFTINLPNDGKYVVAGVVSKDAAGFYSPMGVSAVTRKGVAPSKPGGVIFRKK